MTALTLSPRHHDARPHRGATQSTFAVVVFGLAVIAAVAVALAYAIPRVPDLGALYITVT